MDTDVVAAEVAPEVLANLQALLADLFIPLVAAQQAGRAAAESAKDEFVQVRRCRADASGSRPHQRRGRKGVQVGISLHPPSAAPTSTPACRAPPSLRRRSQKRRRARVAAPSWRCPSPSCCRRWWATAASSRSRARRQTPRSWPPSQRRSRAGAPPWTARWRRARWRARMPRTQVGAVGCLVGLKVGGGCVLVLPLPAGLRAQADAPFSSDAASPQAPRRSWLTGAAA